MVTGELLVAAHRGVSSGLEGRVRGVSVGMGGGTVTGGVVVAQSRGEEPWTRVRLSSSESRPCRK